MNRSDFQKLSKLRIREARVLLDSGQFHGAYYLAGYSIECALKACVAKQVKRHDFPDKKLAIEAWQHELEKLVKLAGFALDFEKDRKTDQNLEVNWAIVKDWSESSRYDLEITEVKARDFYNACTARGHGILSWIKKRW
jgi:HEPN domain-containing protein